MDSITCENASVNLATEYTETKRTKMKLRAETAGAVG